MVLQGHGIVSDYIRLRAGEKDWQYDEDRRINLDRRYDARRFVDGKSAKDIQKHTSSIYTKY
jgi:hypothetical protein